MVGVAVVDDHPLARRGIVTILEAGGLRVIHSLATPDVLYAAGQVDGVDVVMLDLYLDDDQPALTTVHQLAAVKPVLVISASRRPGDVVAALHEGASGYITKHSTEDRLLGAVRSVASGEFHLSAQLADILHAELDLLPSEKASRLTPVLSDRERQVLGYIARGFTHSQTATRMSVSTSTVDTYVSRIRSKLQVGNKAQLTLAAIEQLDRRTSFRP